MTHERSTQEAVNLVMEKMGMLPNMLRDLAEVSPAATMMYVRAAEALTDGRFGPAEQHTIMLAVSVRNGCHYCSPVHHTLAEARGVSDEALQAITSGVEPSEPRLAVLVRATWLIMDKKGWLDEADLAELEADGVDRQQVFEIVGFVALKTMSNYINHINKTPVDVPFKRHATGPPSPPDQL